jgi:hypothetical protein
MSSQSAHGGSQNISVDLAVTMVRRWRTCPSFQTIGAHSSGLQPLHPDQELALAAIGTFEVPRAIVKLRSEGIFPKWSDSRIVSSKSEVQGEPTKASNRG